MRGTSLPTSRRVMEAHMAPILSLVPLDLLSSCFDPRQDHSEGGAAFGRAFRLNGATQYACDQVVNDIQPQPAAALTQPGGEERLEDAMQYRFRDANAVVRVVELDAIGIE